MLSNDLKNCLYNMTFVTMQEMLKTFEWELVGDSLLEFDSKLFLCLHLYTNCFAWKTMACDMMIKKGLLSHTFPPLMLSLLSLESDFGT